MLASHTRSTHGIVYVELVSNSCRIRVEIMSAYTSTPTHKCRTEKSMQQGQHGTLNTHEGCKWLVAAAGPYGMPLVSGPWTSCGRSASRPPKPVVVEEVVPPWNWMLRPTHSVPLHLRQSVIRTAVWCRETVPTHSIPSYSLRESHTKGDEGVLHTIHCKTAGVRNASHHQLAIQDVDHVVLCPDVNVAELSQAADCLAHNTNNACAPAMTGPVRS